MPRSAFSVRVPRLWYVTLFAPFAVACAASDSGSGPAPTNDSGSPSDSAPTGDDASFDTGSIATDSGTPVDSGPDSAIGNDTGSGDTGSSSDTGVADTNASDTNVATDSGSVDSGTADSGSVDTGPVDGGVGTMLFAGSFEPIGGTTDDDYVAYSDLAASPSTLSAISLAGGAPILLDANYDRQSGVAYAAGKGILFWTGVSTTDNVGALHFWTKAGGPHSLGSASNYRAAVAVSSDASAVLFDDNATTSTFDLVIANADGSNRKVLVTGAANDATNCPSFAQNAGAHLFVVYCTASGSGQPATVGVVDPAARTISTIGANLAPFFSIDPAGTRLAVVDSNGAASVYDVTVAPAKATAIDKNVESIFVTPDGQSVVYSVVSGTGSAAKRVLKRAKTDGTGVTVLGDLQGNGAFLATSPSLAQIVYAGSFDPTNPTSDLNVVNAAAPPATSKSLDKNTDALVANGFGDVFTMDEKFVLYITNYDNTTYTGQLNVASAASGATISTATGVWTAFASTGGKIVYNDNYSQPAADIHLLDTSAASPSPKLVVAGANANFYLSHAKDRIVYATDSAPAGIFVTNVP